MRSNFDGYIYIYKATIKNTFRPNKFLYKFSVGYLALFFKFTQVVHQLSLRFPAEFLIDGKTEVK